MKKTILNILNFSFILGLVACGGSDSSKSQISTSSNPQEDNKWNISLSGNDNVYAEIIEYEDDLELLITGSGKMKSYKDRVNVPWAKYADSINSVLIGSGITNVGSNVFYDINLEYIYLPDTVKDVEDNAAKETTALLSYIDDVSYSDEVKNVYNYVEKDLNIEDRYWLSGYSSGNIIPDNYEFDTHKRYWYEGENNEPVIKTKILFIGNSFTYRNGVIDNSGGVPGIFDNIAESLGYKCETYSVTGPGWYLESHANSYDNCGKQIDKLLDSCIDFDYIVLQEQSMAPFQNYDKFLRGVKELQKKVKDTQYNAQIVLYQTWGSPYSANQIGSTIAGMEKLLRDGYEKAAEECGITSISPVGKAFTKSYYDNSSIYLWDSDNRHQSYQGAYLSACVHVAHILGADVRKTDFEGEAKYQVPSLPKSTYEYLRDVAYKVAVEKVEVNYENNTIEDNENGPAVSNDVIVIAGWGRFIEEDRFNSLMNDFIIYLKENSIKYNEVIGNYYLGTTTSDPYYYIADFSAKIVSDGGADIILPCADNFNANQANIAAISPFTPIDVYGQTNRRVALTYEYELSLAFIDYIKTPSAIEILTK